MFLRSFGSFNPSTMDFEADLFLRQKWKETRFENNNLSDPLDLSDPQLVKRIWKPEVYFPNAKSGEFQYVTVPNVMLRLYPSGEVLYQIRLKLTFSCMMDLYKYPLDHQVCFMELASFSKTTREMYLTWLEGDAKSDVILSGDLKLPQFSLESVQTTECTVQFTIGNYSCLKANFHLSRNLGDHLVQSYLPTTLIVMISWVSFWLDIDSVPSRVTLGITTLLTVCTESSGVKEKVPPVSYVKALDVWLTACTAFVFSTLLEFTLVSYVSRRERERLLRESIRFNTKRHRHQGSDPKTKPPDDLPATSPPNGDLPTFHCLWCHRASPDIRSLDRNWLWANCIDKTSRVAFPAAFFLFNLAYWTYYKFIA